MPHVDSCFKVSMSSKKGHCRYSFPRRAGFETTIEDNLCLSIGRRHHNEYINCFNDVIALTFSCNHDIRFLLGGTTDAVYYVMKYLTKGSVSTGEVEKATIASFDRRRKAENERKTDNLPISLIKTGRARVNSMAAALVKMQEVPATLCALYMRRKTVVFASHKFGKLLLGQTMSFIRAEKHESDLVPEKEGKFVSTSQYFDYTFRSIELEDLCLMEFVAGYNRAQFPEPNESRRKRNFSATRASTISPFLRGHPLFETHGLRKRSPSVIPDIIGPRIPDSEDLDSTEKKEQYALMALILLFPFRTSTDLLQGTTCYWESFQMFSHCEKFEHRARTILENFQEYYVSKHSPPRQDNTGFILKDNDNNDEAEQSNECVTNEIGEEDGDCIEHFDPVLEGSSGIRVFAPADLMNFLVASKGFHAVHSSKIDMIANHGIGRRCVETLGMSVMKTSRGMRTRHKTDAHRNAVNDSNILDWVESVPYEYDDVALEYENVSHGDADDQSELSKSLPKQSSDEKRCQECEKDNEDDTTVQYLSEALKELENKSARQPVGTARSSSPSPSSLRCGHYDSISSVIEKFSLNSLQQKAFALVAEELILRMAAGYGLSVTTDQESTRRNGKPFTMYLGGEGGTGKTRVVEALIEFCKSWKRPKAIRTCAPTGIAASLVHGQTLHSLLGIRGGRGFNAKKKPSKKIMDECEGTLLVIIDEVSMLTRKMLSALDAFLRKVKETDVPYGGAMMLFCGDFFQIPPVFSDPIYMSPKPASCGAEVEEKIGNELWQELKYAIILTESMRQKDDKQFSECLGRVRVGKATKQDLESLNSRVLSSQGLSKLQRIQKDYVPLIVRSNLLRVALNWGMIKTRAKVLQCKPVICVAQIKCRDQISIKDLETICCANDTDTGNISILLPLLPGMPVRITCNVSIPLGIANGTQGFLEGVSFPQKATFSEISLFGVECAMCDMLPKVAYVSSPMFSKKLRKRFPNLPTRYEDDTLPVVPTSVEQVAPKLRKRLQCKQRISFKQLPFVPAYATTTYKVQGVTADGIVVFPLFKECNLPPPKATLYVVLSRVRTLSSLFLLEELKEEDLEYFSPTTELLEEENRLIELHQRTIAE